MKSHDCARSRAFTLIEVLVVVAILALLVAILVPSLAKARLAAKQTLCLHNIRSMEQAHWIYMTSNNGYLIQAGLGHQNEDNDLPLAWITTLQRIYKEKLLFHSPVDDSPHWPIDQGGEGDPVRDDLGNIVLDSAGKTFYRRTSYGINDFVAANKAPDMDGTGPRVWRKIEKIPSPSAIVHFLFMVKTGSDFAGSDHPHVVLWDTNDPAREAAKQVQIDAYGGPARHKTSIAPYGFLDGHAEKLQFQKVYKDLNHNKFDPYLFHNKY